MARRDWSDEALRDVREIHEWIARDSLSLADRITDDIFDKVMDLERFPEIGAPVEEEGFEGLRELLVEKFRIIYHYRDGVCRILCVTRGSRDLRRLLDPDNLP